MPYIDICDDDLESVLEEIGFLTKDGWHGKQWCDLTCDEMWAAMDEAYEWLMEKEGSKT